MATSDINAPTVAGLIPIYVSKTVTIAGFGTTTIDLSEFIPSGKRIRMLNTAFLNNNMLPYINDMDQKTWIDRVNYTDIIIKNTASEWTNYGFYCFIYV